MILFYLVFSSGLLFVATEEIRSVHQKLFKSASISQENINYSNQSVIKSFQIWRNNLELFPLIFGFGGLMGIWVSKKQHFRYIGSPSILWPYFTVIAVVSALDLSHDFYVYSPKLDDLVNGSEEVIEMMVGISGMLFVWLNMKRFKIGRDRLFE